ncbi:MAG: hypothetical protein A2Z86_10180 [Candidatus Glassbacteria bacterium GWA2_58_10]|uniref:PDZ domain-containing protein n=3 Tax=Candidatus Glassiibacteriota TaxID=1817805 RepID=A0A1F5YEP2_9BACT|nr:MAG: hypothetical protein A2Z86_10180 [Candidatus Glassbacteria bacterium GWA2_58_10]
MNFNRVKNPYVYASCTILVILMLGWLFGRLMATSDNTYMRVLLLQDVVHQVSQRYVDYIPPDSLYRRAVEGLLRGLDPYTELIPATEFKRFQELQVKSEYVGTGISISRTDNEIVVMSTFPGSSAYRQGIQPGDRVIRVDGISTRNWSTEEASLHLLGPENSKVSLTVSRPGAPEPLDISLTREKVAVPTVTRQFMLDKGVGYLRLSSFTEPTAHELEAAVNALLGQGMKSLVLDLRDNTGGLTESAIEICGLFLNGRQLIVSMRGRRKEDTSSFFSEGKPVFKTQPIAILTNSFTASSSEIVAGALQDHDRAIIVGTNSFGKGLVQTTFPLNSGDILKITTARYYTPSGRNIQREYPRQLDLGDEELEPEAQDTVQKSFKTDMGRKVLGGGGIAPDIEVPEDSAAGDPFIVQILPHAFDFAVAYKSLHPNLDKSFSVDPAIFSAFISYLKDKSVEVEDKKVEKYHGYIANILLTYRISQVTWDENTAYRMVAHADAQLNKALEILGSGEKQAEILKQTMKDERK